MIHFYISVTPIQSVFCHPLCTVEASNKNRRTLMNINYNLRATKLRKLNCFLYDVKKTKKCQGAFFLNFVLADYNGTVAKFKQLNLN